MSDPYLIPGSKVLRNLLNITDEKSLDFAEAELSRANMMLLYESGFADFSTVGLCKIHKALFCDVYDWAGTFRTINIQKKEEILAGASVWYSNEDAIEAELNKLWNKILGIDWDTLSREEFALAMAHQFPALWKVHPFREGNTRTVVMLMAFFAEHYGYYFDQDLLARSAEYVRNSFVLASIGEYAEYHHLEKILLDTICIEPIDLDVEVPKHSRNGRQDRVRQYERHGYKPKPHEYREDDE